MMTVIVDYKMGNIGSVANMFRKIGAIIKISSDKTEIASAKKIILPGVGAFDEGMKNLTNQDLISTLNNKVLEQNTPILGICLGTQLFTRRSEEGKLPGLGWLEADTIRFNFEKAEKNSNLKIPHMGWNTINPVDPDNILLKNLDNQSRFYFVHSYHLKCDNNNIVVASATHGFDFPAIIQKNNIFGMQFHPEKSHKFGQQILKNFLNLNPC